MASTYMERRLASVMIREMKVKPTVTQHLTPVTDGITSAVCCSLTEIAANCFQYIPWDGFSQWTSSESRQVMTSTVNMGFPRELPDRSNNYCFHNQIVNFSGQNSVYFFPFSNAFMTSVIFLFFFIMRW